MKDLWVNKYSPTNFTDYSFQNDDHKNQVLSWITEGIIPNLLLHGPAGTGKTSCAKLLINELGIHEFDYLIVNGSNEGRQIEWLRDKLETFCQSMPFGEFKIVLIDEAEYLNCLEENEKIIMSDGTLVALKDLDPHVEHSVLSFNKDTKEFEPDTAVILSEKIDDVYEVKFDDGSTLCLTLDHPLMVIDENDMVVEKTVQEIMYSNVKYDVVFRES